MTKKTKKQTAEEKVEVILEQSDTETQNGNTPEIFSRVFFTLLFALIGWLSLWVFGFVVLIQFGFLLITGKVNKNLKGFNQEVGLFLFDLIKYLSFQTNDKPFPFRDWPYGDEEISKNKNELNEADVVKATK